MCRQVISHLYEDHGEAVAGMLDGMFSFVLMDTNNDSFLVARVSVAGWVGRMRAVASRVGVWAWRGVHLRVVLVGPA